MWERRRTMSSGLAGRFFSAGSVGRRHAAPAAGYWLNGKTAARHGTRETDHGQRRGPAHPAAHWNSLLFSSMSKSRFSSRKEAYSMVDFRLFASMSAFFSDRLKRRENLCTVCSICALVVPSS